MKNNQPMRENFVQQNENIQPAGRNFHNQKTNDHDQREDYLDQRENIQPSGSNQQRREHYKNKNYQNKNRNTNQNQDEDFHPDGTNNFTRGKVSEAQYTSYNVGVSNRFTYLNC